MDFATWLAVCRPSGRKISTRTIRKYISEAIAWMRREFSCDFAGGLDLRNLRDLLKGMRRELGDTPRQRVRRLFHRVASRVESGALADGELLRGVRG